MDVNIFFCEIVKTEWVSSIQLTKSREAEIQSSSVCDISLHYPQTIEAFDDLVEEFKLKSIGDSDSSINTNNYGKKKKIDRLIVSGLADCSNIFICNFFNGHKKIWLSLHMLYCKKRKLYHKLTFSIFFQSLFLSKLSRRYCRLTLLEQQQDAYQLGLCG